MSCSQLAYYKLLPIVNIVPRNVYQSNQRAMLIYGPPVNLCTINWYQTKISYQEMYIRVTKEQC